MVQFYIPYAYGTGTYHMRMYTLATCNNLKYRAIALVLQFLYLLAIAPFYLHAPPIDSTIDYIYALST